MVWGDVVAVSIAFMLAVTLALCVYWAIKFVVSIVTGA